jgi:uncharacterized RDD family membrane protein YckC
MSTAPPVVFKSMSFKGASAPSAPPAVWKVAGRRGLAGTVDLVVTAGLFVLVAALAGTIDTSHGLSVSLHGPPTLLFLAAFFLYHFTTEALTGRTLGKALTGLRVARAEDGGRPGPGAIAVRTLLRPVDGLPLLYGVGAVAMLASPSRQRIGDLAARTVVVRGRR